MKTPIAHRVLHRRRPATSVRILAAGLLILGFALTVGGCGGEDASPSGGEVFTQNEGEIFLEPSGVAGPDSFAGETFVAAGPTTTFSLPTGSNIPQIPARPAATTPGGGVQISSYAGDTPALYGGSRGKASCDKEAQLVFLEQNADKAAAFCEALNSDPTLRWEGGNQLRPDQLRDYFAELTPMILTHDTRVTNHGYRDGHPTPRQSVLQAGQAVLVDRYGVIRVRCECGNPLIPARAVTKTPTYSGPSWEGFDPAQTVVVQPTTAIIDVFVVIDVDTGEVFERPAGTTGSEDAPHEVDTSSATSSSTTSSSTSSTTTSSSTTSSSSTTTTTTIISTTLTTRTTTTTTTTTTEVTTTTSSSSTTTSTTESPVKVPRVVGMSLTQAKDVLARSGLKARIYSDPAMYLVRPPDVTGQRPEAGTLVSRGSVVELKCYGVGDNYPVWPY